jgi:hypothetical protein
MQVDFSSRHASTARFATGAKVAEAMTRHVSLMGGDLSPDARSPASDELLNRVFVELVRFPDGSAPNPLWLKARTNPQVDFSDPYVTKNPIDILVRPIINMMKYFPVIPDNGWGVTFSLVAGIADTYDHWDTLSSKEVSASIFDEFAAITSFFAARAIPGFDGWPSHLVNLGIMTCEHIYLVRGQKNQEAIDRETTSSLSLAPRNS